jgi:hypothetical protein
MSITNISAMQFVPFKSAVLQTEVKQIIIALPNTALVPADYIVTWLTHYVT